MQFDHTENEPRQVLPRWRSLNRTPSAEMRSTAGKASSSHSAEDFDRALQSWQHEASLPNALDVVFAASVTSSIGPARGAITQVLSSDALEGVKDLVRRLVEGPTVPRLTGTESGTHPLREEIRRLKRHALLSQRNPIVHCELARIYTNLGQNRSALRQIELALKLAPWSRYILRSAARFFVHNQDIERARQVMRHIDGSDPWLLATHTALTDLLGKQQRLAKRGMNIIQPLARKPEQITELASALATVEWHHGNIRSARRLFRTSLVAPNENAVAQARWAAAQDVLTFDVGLLDVNWAFEARAFHARRLRRWPKALDSCEEWHQDEPFSTRPIQVGSFISAEIVGDLRRAETMCRAALVSNPDNLSLRNNLVYALAMQDKLDEAASE